MVQQLACLHDARQSETSISSQTIESRAGASKSSSSAGRFTFLLRLFARLKRFVQSLVSSSIGETVRQLTYLFSFELMRHAAHCSAAAGSVEVLVNADNFEGPEPRRRIRSEIKTPSATLYPCAMVQQLIALDDALQKCSK